MCLPHWQSKFCSTPFLHHFGMKWHRDIESYNIAKCFLNVRNGEILEFIERYCNMESGRIPTIPNFILSHSPLNSFDFSRLFQNGPAAAAPIPHHLLEQRTYHYMIIITDTVLFLKGYFWFAGKELPKTIHTFHLDIVRLPVYNSADGVWRKDVWRWNICPVLRR